VIYTAHATGSNITVLFLVHSCCAPSSHGKAQSHARLKLEAGLSLPSVRSGHFGREGGGVSCCEQAGQGSGNEYHLSCQSKANGQQKTRGGVGHTPFGTMYARHPSTELSSPRLQFSLQAAKLAGCFCALTCTELSMPCLEASRLGIVLNGTDHEKRSSRRRGWAGQ